MKVIRISVYLSKFSVTKREDRPVRRCGMLTSRKGYNKPVDLKLGGFLSRRAYWFYSHRAVFVNLFCKSLEILHKTKIVRTHILDMAIIIQWSGGGGGQQGV